MKNIVSLNGEWHLAGFDEGCGNLVDPAAQSAAGAITAAATVPGEVHVDLLRAGLIADPFYAADADLAQWVEEKEWWYWRRFELDDDFARTRTFLEFDGLDTFATVFFNGQEVGRAENMFVAHRFEVTELLQPGENSVAVRFDPAAKVLQRMDHSGLFGCFDTPRVNARKMQCSFGWDWTPRLVGAGIWRDARLVSYDTVGISDVHVESEIQGATANAWVTVEVENFTTRDQQVMASIVVALGANREKIEVAETVSPFGGVIEAVIRIEEPQLWWPNGMGEQPLYTCMVGLQVEGEVQDVAETRFGVRTVRIVERDEAGANAFTLHINGEPVFCKGGNWIPADHFVSRITDTRYAELLRLARDANFNMLRVWGGGIYEVPAFYQACDEMGIMVWQDFMFSCATYPEDEAFRGAVAREAEFIVKQLRDHPSIVIWCGNNECEMNHPPDAQWRGKALFHETIPAVLARLDKTRPYRPCSPFGGATGNDPSEGDLHRSSWFRAYLGDTRQWRYMIEEERGLFVSEFVTQGPPAVESVREFIPEERLFPPDNEMWEYHNKDNPHSFRTDGLSHQQILLELTRRIMGDFSTVEEFCAYAGILQGEFIKAEAEHYRREKWAISGGLMWMYNDCWPAIDWSVVDYYLRPKIAYYYTKRAFAPTIVSFKQLADRVQLYVTSDDRLRPVRGEMQVGVFSFGTCGFDVQEFEADLAPNSSRSFWESLPLDELFPDPARQCLVALLRVRGEIVTKNVYFPLPFREMDFPQPKLLVAREQIEENRHVITVSADAYARNVALVGVPGSASVSDNYFDLLPGEAHAVTIENISAEQVAQLAVNVWRR